MFWYLGLSVAAMSWVASILNRPWLSPRRLADVCFLAIMGPAGLLVTVDLYLMRTANPLRSLTLALSTFVTVAGSNLLIAAGVLESTIPKLQQRALAAHENGELDPVHTEAERPRRLSKVARLYRLAARLIDLRELEHGLPEGASSISEEASPTHKPRPPRQRHPLNDGTETSDRPVHQSSPAPAHREKGATRLRNPRTTTARERSRIVNT